MWQNFTRAWKNVANGRIFRLQNILWQNVHVRGILSEFSRGKIFTGKDSAARKILPCKHLRRENSAMWKVCDWKFCHIKHNFNVTKFLTRVVEFSRSKINFQIAVLTCIKMLTLKDIHTKICPLKFCHITCRNFFVAKFSRGKILHVREKISSGWIFTCKILHTEKFSRHRIFTSNF